MDDLNNKVKSSTISGMPASINELGLSELQLGLALDYWMHRRNMARKQRDGLLALLMVGGGTLMMRSLNGFELKGEASALATFAESLASWMLPIGLGLCVITLIMTEFIVMKVNKNLANPALKLTPNAIEKVRDIGNSIAIHILLFRRTPGSGV